MTMQLTTTNLLNRTLSSSLTLKDSFVSKLHSKQNVLTSEDTIAFSNASALSHSKTVRFGNTSDVPNPDALAIAKMDSLLPQLAQATQWEMVVQQDKYGEMSVGGDLKFTLGDKRYTMRDVTEDPDGLPAWLNPGCVLIEETANPQGIPVKTEYPMDYEKTFVKYWPQFSKVGMPLMADRCISQILPNVINLKSPMFIASQENGVVSFHLGDKQYRLEWNKEKERYNLSEPSYPSADQLEAFRQTLNATYTERNEERDTQADPQGKHYTILSSEQFAERYKKNWVRNNNYNITAEQFEQLFDAIKIPMGQKLSENLGIGADLSPRPLIRTIATRLLNDVENGGVGYREHDERDEITYYPTQGQPDHDWQTALFFEISKVPKKDDGDNYYRIYSRGGKQGHINLKITSPQEEALLDKVMDVVKTKDALRSIKMSEGLLQNVDLWKRINPDFQPKDYTQEKAQLQAQQTQLLAELSQMLPTLAK
jgi:hypothetical protein